MLDKLVNRHAHYNYQGGEGGGGGSMQSDVEKYYKLLDNTV